MTAYRISTAAQKAGFSASALRFYEASGLVPEAVRTPAGYRMYDDEAVDRLRFVHRARGLGLPLDEVRELVAIWDAGACAPVQHDLGAHIARRRARIQTRMTELQTLAAQLRAAELAVLAAPNDGKCGPGCACLATADDTPAALACTLDAEQLPGRIEAWQDLAALAMTREPVALGTRLVFEAREGLATQIAGLCALEQACCAFFTFTLVLTPGRITLDITAPDGAGELARALLDLQPARAGPVICV